MAWFNFGKKNDSFQAGLADEPLETVDNLRSRAKRRLVGALVLVLTAVVGFPLLFDTQPRPVLVDVPIEIPDKAKSKPLAAPPVATAPPVSTLPAPAARVDEKASLQAKEEIVPPGPAVSKPDSPQVQANNTPVATKSVATIAPPAAPSAAPVAPVADASAANKAAQEKATADKTAAEKAAAQKAAKEKSEKEKTAADTAAAKKAEAARAQALLEGKPAQASTAAPADAASPASERFIVQFGSFADESKAREVRQKVERAGLKTYAQIAETSEGKRHRVRVGPFATRAEADKAASKIKALDLPAAILTL